MDFGEQMEQMFTKASQNSESAPLAAKISLRLSFM
jgi:hypothetical protein